MTAHKGVNQTKLTTSRWTPQDVKENSAPIRVVDDTVVCAAASGDTLTMVAPPAHAKLDLMTSIIFISTMSATAAVDIGSDSGATGAQTALFAAQTAPSGKKLTFDSVGFFNKEWDGGELLFTFSGSYTTATITVKTQLAYKDVP
ncbi:hypothetical protein LCGC14_1175800 [marine sediment metagenome]|uniref:Uncharacterized protein n=1 Tax=marine sediment metagenome TaxID=412755 RepID=A0A0F9LTE6_9ZZZZ